MQQIYRRTPVNMNVNVMVNEVVVLLELWMKVNKINEEVKTEKNINFEVSLWNIDLDWKGKVSTVAGKFFFYLGFL